MKIRNTHSIDLDPVVTKGCGSRPRSNGIFGAFRFAAVLIFCSSFVARAEGDVSLEYKVKTVFLYNFTKFIEWPPGSMPEDGDFVIGIFGDDQFGDGLSYFADKKVRGRKIMVRKFAYVDDLEPCHILFICSSAKFNHGRILAAVADWHVLTVGEWEWFATNGGVINFVSRGGKVNFEINQAAAGRAGLRISSNLLNLATIVTE